jgi:hypothetical protein
MSSPVHDDIDRHVMYAPPWARETPQRRDRDQHEQPLAERAKRMDIEAGMVEAVRATWTPPTLDPVVMPEPPRQWLSGPTWGMFARLTGAVGFAAAVALFVTGAVPLPSIDISLSSNEGAKAASALAQVFGIRDPRKEGPLLVADASPSVTLPASAVGVPTTDAPPPSPPSPPAAVRAEALTSFASLDITAAAAATAPLASRVESAPAIAAAPAEKPPELRPLDRDEVAGLVKRGEALLAEGDIASARLLLRRAAEAGDGTAALALAGTYDRVELAKLKVIGVVHDHVQAKAWYTKALEHGSAEAARRLQQLAQRSD